MFVSGHIGISVPDVDAACKLFEREKVTFVKKPDSGESESFHLCKKRLKTVISQLLFQRKLKQSDEQQ